MKLLQWLHVACTDTLVWMARHAKRGRPKQSTATHLLGRRREHAQDVWRFAGHALVPFTNNAAEQLMRTLKVKLKIAGTFRTEARADTFCAIRSYLATMARQGHSAFECLGPGAAGPDPSTPVQLIGRLGGTAAWRLPTLARLSA